MTKSNFAGVEWIAAESGHPTIYAKYQKYQFHHNVGIEAGSFAGERNKFKIINNHWKENVWTERLLLGIFHKPNIYDRWLLQKLRLHKWLISDLERFRVHLLLRVWEADLVLGREQMRRQLSFGRTRPERSLCQELSAGPPVLGRTRLCQSVPLPKAYSRRKQMRSVLCIGRTVLHLRRSLLHSMLHAFF